MNLFHRDVTLVLVRPGWLPNQRPNRLNVQSGLLYFSLNIFQYFCYGALSLSKSLY